MSLASSPEEWKAQWYAYYEADDAWNANGRQGAEPEQPQWDDASGGTQPPPPPRPGH